MIRSNLSFLPGGSGLVAFTLDGAAAGDEWETILVGYNGDAEPRRLNLPSGSWTIVVNDAQAGVESLGQAQGAIELPAYSMVVLHQ